MAGEFAGPGETIELRPTMWPGWRRPVTPRLLNRSKGRELAIEDVWRRESPHVLAALLRRHGDLADCEDATQEALEAAARQWPSDGVPDNPRAG